MRLNSLNSINKPEQSIQYSHREWLNSLNSVAQQNYFEFLPPLAWVFDTQQLNLSPVSAGNYITQEFSYPITPITTLDTNEKITKQWAAPLLHVNYVEIKGLPNNINSK